VLERASQDRIAVPFAGPAGTAPLTWGQKTTLIRMREAGWRESGWRREGTFGRLAAFSAAFYTPEPEGTTVEDVAAQISDMMSRHAALRLRIGTDSRGQPCQLVSGSGLVPLDIVTIPDDEDPADVTKYANELWFERMFAPVDLDRDLPVQMAVIRHRGVIRCRVWMIHNIAVDGEAATLLAFGGMSGRRPADPAATSSLDLARREQTPALRKASDRAMRYWESHLRHIPPLTFGEPAHPHGRLGERYWHGEFISPAAHLAILAIAGRTRTDTSRVLLAIIAIAIGRAAGLRELTTRVFVNNRFRPGYAEIIAPLNQASVVTIDLGGATVDEVVARTRRAMLPAGLHGYYDPEQLQELRARLDVERGYPAWLTCLISDGRGRTKPAVDAAAGTAQVTMEQIRRKLPETTMSWNGTIDVSPDQARLVVDNQPDTIAVGLIFDMACFTEAQVEALARGIEEVAVAAAFDPAVPAGIAAGPAPA
jgi:condensation domain-containing protein